MVLSCKHLEVVDHARGDQQPEDREKFALGEQVGFARLPDGVRNLAHALVDRQGLGLFVLDQAEYRADETDQDAEIHQRGTADAAQPVEFHLREVGDFNVCFAGSHAAGQQEQSSND